MQLQDSEKNVRTRFNTMDVVCLVDLEGYVLDVWSDWIMNSDCHLYSKVVVILPLTKMDRYWIELLFPLAAIHKLGIPSEFFIRFQHLQLLRGCAHP